MKAFERKFQVGQSVWLYSPQVAQELFMLTSWLLQKESSTLIGSSVCQRKRKKLKQMFPSKVYPSYSSHMIKRQKTYRERLQVKTKYWAQLWMLFQKLWTGKVTLKHNLVLNHQVWTRYLFLLSKRKLGLANPIKRVLTMKYIQ